MVVVYFVIVLGVLIFVHELGHFLVAKYFNVKVEKFSLGFGPRMFSRTVGETEYLISAIPLGGYVKMFGESGYIEGSDAPAGSVETAPVAETDVPPQRELTDEEKKRSFAHKSPLIRMAIVLAGPLFNLLFAWLILIILTLSGVPTLTSKIEVVPDKPAIKAGIQNNDVITSLNGTSISSFDELAAIVEKTRGGQISVTVRRDNRLLSFTVIPESIESKTLFGEPTRRFIIGVRPVGEIVTAQYGFVESISRGSSQTWKVIELTVLSLVKLIQRVVPMDNVGGPIMIAKMAHEQAEAGGANFLAFIALISINLGILNLLPVPVLDGGHLVFFTLEIVLRRPLNQKIREYAQQFGMIVLMGLMVLAFYNDIMRFFNGSG